MRDPVAAGARFLLLDEAVTAVDMTSGDIGLLLNWRYGPLGEAIDDLSFITQAHAFTGLGLAALQPGASARQARSGRPATGLSSGSGGPASTATAGRPRTYRFRRRASSTRSKSSTAWRQRAAHRHRARRRSLSLYRRGPDHRLRFAAMERRHPRHPDQRWPTAPGARRSADLRLPALRKGKMTESAKLRLPYIAASQAQKHVTHNEALTLLDTLVASERDRQGLDHAADEPGRGRLLHRRRPPAPGVVRLGQSHRPLHRWRVALLSPRRRLGRRLARLRPGRGCALRLHRQRLAASTLPPSPPRPRFSPEPRRPRRDPRRARGAMGEGIDVAWPRPSRSAKAASSTSPAPRPSPTSTSPRRRMGAGPGSCSTAR